MAVAGGARGRISFQRRPGAGPRPPALPGTRPSVRHGQLLLSSGLPSLDCVLGGGVAVGTLLLIEEDKYGLYSNLLFKYFLAEGIVCGHELFVASAKEHPDNILKGAWSALDQVIQKGSLQTSVDSQSNTDSFCYEKIA